MKIKETTLALAAVLALAALPSAPARAAPRVTVVPETYLVGYDPVTFFFARDTGPRKGGPEDHPARYVHMTPSHPGAFRWIDARTLMFRPATPWPPLARIRLRVAGRTKVLTTLMAAPSSMIPANGTNNLGPVHSVTLSFAEPVGKKDLARMVRLEVRPLPGEDTERPTVVGPEGFRVKTLERKSRRNPARYVLRLLHPIGDGHEVTVRVRLSLSEDPKVSVARLRFSTRPRFRVVAAGCAAPGATSNDPVRSPVPGLLPLTPNGSRYTVEQAIDGGSAMQLAVAFTSPPDGLDLGLVKRLVRFSPSVRDMSFAQSGDYVYVKGHFARGTVYTATISPTPIRDVSGRRLSMRGRSVFHFFFPVQTSFLRFGAGHGVMERFGPKTFPVAGRGDDRVDLRIYPIDPLDRRFWPFSDSPVIVDESKAPPGPGERPESPAKRSGPPSQGELATRISLLGSPPVSHVVQLPLSRTTGAATFGLSLGSDLKRLSGTHAPGSYLVGIRRIGAGTRRAYVRVDVTDLALTTVEDGKKVAFYVSSLSTGRPVDGATVEIQGVEPGAKTYAFHTILRGRTDGRGLFVFPHDREVDGSMRRVVVRKGDDVLALSTSSPPSSFSSNQWYGGGSGWLAWLGNQPPTEKDEGRYLGHLVTERPVYRPDEVVHVLGWMRWRHRGHLSFPSDSAARLVVHSPDGRLRRFKVRLDRAGGFSYDFSGKKLPTGDYEASLTGPKGEGPYATVDWKMEAYRIPRFHVDLHAPDAVGMDRPFDVDVTASYYAGGRVSGQPVQWRVRQLPYAWTPKSEPGYLFSTDERYSRATRFVPPAAIEKHETTDANGGSRITVNPARNPDARPRRYIFEATVTGADDQTVTSARSVVALPPFVVGMKVDRFIHGKKTIHPRILVLGPDGKRVAGKKLTVRLLARRWHSHLAETDFASGTPRYVTDVVDEKVLERTVTSRKTPVTLSLPARRAGIYVVEVSTHDALGRLALLSVDLYVAGKGPVPWKKPENQVFGTAPDKPAYAPGETAKVVLESPFQTGRVLAIVEAPEGTRYDELTVHGGKAVFRLPIEATFAPRIPVHFVLMRGRITSPKGPGDTDLGKPQTVAATRWLRVKPLGNEVLVTLDHPKKALPGQRIPMRIHLRKPSGAPVSGEVSLWLVDKAVLSLGKEGPLDPLPSFVVGRASKVTVRDTRNAVLGRLPMVEQPGGGGEEDESQGLGRITVRKVFKSVPFFRARIHVGGSGNAKVWVKLSDDLTVFAVRAIATSGAERFGIARSSVRVRLPVIVQPALPRFVRIGDRFEAGGVARVVEGKGGAGRCAVSVTGARVRKKACKVTLEKGRPARVDFELTALPPSLADAAPGKSPKMSMRLAVERTSDGAADAFEVKIPVLPDRAPSQRERFFDLSPGETLTLKALPGRVRPGSVRRQLLVTTKAPVLRLMSGLDYLFAYQESCTEQRVSMAYPAVAFRTVAKNLDLPIDPKIVHEMVLETLDYLSSTIGRDGLYSFWPGGRGNVSLTAYVVDFLATAKKAGYQVPDALYDPAIRALTEALRSDYSRFIDRMVFVERGDALAALAAAGHFDVSYGSSLAREARGGDLYAEARILDALRVGKLGDSALASSLREDLWSGTVFMLHHGKRVYGGLQGARQIGSPLVLSSEIQTQSAMVRALYPTDAGQARMHLMVDDLVSRGTGDGWGDTHATAEALLALDRVLGGAHGDGPGLSATLTLGGSRHRLDVDASHPTASFVTADPGKGTLVAGQGGKKVRVRASVTWLPRAAGDQTPAKSAGFVVTREIIRVPDGDAPPKRTEIDKAGQRFVFHTGDVVETHVQVIVPATRHYVVVVAPLAAGMEPMNPNLATAPAAAKPSGHLTLAPTYVRYEDDGVHFYYETLPKGTYDFYYRVRATTPGSFVQPPAHAEMMYHPTVNGRSPGARIVVERRR